MSTRTFSRRRRSASSRICTNESRFVPLSRFLDACAPVAEAGEAEAEQFLELINDEKKRSAGQASPLLQALLSG